MTGPDQPEAFRLGYVPGVTPGKWVRTWTERHPDLPLSLVALTAADAAGAVRAREVDAVLLRLGEDRAGLHAIPLYTETTVVVIPKDHLIAAADEIGIDDLADEVLLHPHDDTLGWTTPPGRPAIERPETTGDAVEWVAASVGLLVVPQSLARLHHRRDLTYRTVTGAPESRVALSWLEDETTDAVERFIGVVRGRTVNSTRGGAPAQPARPTPRKAATPRPKAKPAGNVGKRRRRG